MFMSEQSENNIIPNASIGDSTNKEINQPFLTDLTDGRKTGNWESRYSSDAHEHINREKKYLIFVFIGSIILPFILGIVNNEFLKTEHSYLHLKRYIFGFSGGTLGGTMYSAKWLVHSVAKNTWNMDRRLWRIFTPFVSGALAFCIILLMDSGILNITNTDSISLPKAYGIGFLVGYFSDNAIGKLTELAKVFFGSSQTRG
jgi:hypothetical protein